MKSIVQTLRLVDEPEAIAAYRRAHDEIWPVITAGIREVGISRMDLYLDGAAAVMIVEYPDGLDIDAAFARLATLPRQQEWEEYVGQWQLCEPGSTSAGKWKRMEKVFELPISL